MEWDSGDERLVTGWKWWKLLLETLVLTSTIISGGGSCQSQRTTGVDAYMGNRDRVGSRRATYWSNKIWRLKSKSDMAWLFAGCLYRARWKRVTAWIERGCLCHLLWGNSQPLACQQGRQTQTPIAERTTMIIETQTLEDLGQKFWQKSFPSPQASTFWQESRQIKSPLWRILHNPQQAFPVINCMQC